MAHQYDEATVLAILELFIEAGITVDKAYYDVAHATGYNIQEIKQIHDTNQTTKLPPP